METLFSINPGISQEVKQIRRWIVVFGIALLLSGLTAFPIETELRILTPWSDLLPGSVSEWFFYLNKAVLNTNKSYPQLAYGTDWLAFGHIVIAIGLIGPYLDPVRNKWIIVQCIIACALIPPLAFIMGPIREIPVFWTLVDCSFGVFGLPPLILCLRKINRLEINTSIHQSN